MPYETRNPDTARHVIRSRVRRARCGPGAEVEAIAFTVEGLRRVTIICIANKIDIVTEKLKIRDEMSGLSHVVEAPILLIGGCKISFRWKKSRFLLLPTDVEACPACSELR